MMYKNMAAIEDEAVRLRVQTALTDVYDILMLINLHIESGYEVNVESGCISFISPVIHSKRYIIKFTEGYCPVKILVCNIYDKPAKEVELSCQEIPASGP